MVRSIASCLSAIAFVIALAVQQQATAQQKDQPFDPFALDGSQNIVQEEHFGIVNGKIAAGIPYRNVLRINGLWAPPYLSSNFNMEITVSGKPVATKSYQWHPFKVERSGSVGGIDVKSSTMLIPGTRAGLLEFTLTNTGVEPRTAAAAITIEGVTLAQGASATTPFIPAAIATEGVTLDIAEPVDENGGLGWSFARPKSKTATTRKFGDGSLRLEQGGLTIVLRASRDVQWQAASPCGQWTVSLPPSGSATRYVAFAIGPAAEAQAECEKITADLKKTVADAQLAYAKRIEDFFNQLPRFESSNAALERFYYRSLVQFVMNRWDVSEFLLHPYYSTGSINGGCVGNYLWDFGEIWEIFPMFDPAAARSHIKHFLAIDITKHFAFEPVTGKTFGPWYPVNQEKIVGLIYFYVKNTGDTAFLSDIVDDNTILAHAVNNAMFGDDPEKPVNLIDYGPSNSHLELRRGIPYNHVMPDLNGRRYDTYQRAAELTELAGKPDPRLRQRAEELKKVLKQQLWNERAGWFDFRNEKGEKDLRYTVQVFKLFASKVLDAEQEARLLVHLNNPQEFMAEFGLESMAKTDLAYDPVDYDNGGGGCFTAFPAQIAERLYKAGHPDVAANILKRILWWGERMPYWGDSFAANEIDYRHDTPLQSTIDSAAVAQCIIFGMFGVQAEFNGDIRIDPHPPAFARQISLKGLRLRGHVLDIAVDGAEYEVREGAKHVRAAVGQPTLVRGDELIVDAAN
ncbi:MAG: hypothetical protein IT427_14780 [Pirellulales bacterium]|nr:hypothetical protein [Pirellulales bacterium]